MVMYDLKLGRNPFICRFYQSFQYFFRHNKTCILSLQAVVAVWHAFDINRKKFIFRMEFIGSQILPRSTEICLEEHFPKSSISRSEI